MSLFTECPSVGTFSSAGMRYETRRCAQIVGMREPNEPRNVRTFQSANHLYASNYSMQSRRSPMKLTFTLEGLQSKIKLEGLDSKV